MPETKDSTKVQPEVVAHLNGLLHTMRVVQQQEDQFCAAMHAVERAGTLRPADVKELNRLLDQVPGTSLLHEVETIRAMLMQPLADGAGEARESSDAR